MTTVQDRGDDPAHDRPVRLNPTEVTVWWRELRTAALVGTTRREVPESPAIGVPPRKNASREERLLDAAALADALLRAGQLPGARSAADASPATDGGAAADDCSATDAAAAHSVAVDEPAADGEVLPVAPERAGQLLELLVGQGPVGGAARDELVQLWLSTAADAGRILAPRLLLPALELARQRPAVRPALDRPLGRRGHWLAARNPDWSWAIEAEQVDPADIAESAGGERLTATVGAVRTAHPSAAREQVLARWGSDSARDRAAALAGLVVGLSDGDEELLERALDDRAKTVREQAADLLDRLPDSARAQRMADRLRPLLSVHGTLRRSIAVALPDDPDEAARRDGLVDPGPRVSRRGRWLGQIVTGAPLAVWTDLVSDPARVITMLRDEQAEVVLSALRTAAASRGDVTWARALVQTVDDDRLLGLLPATEREPILLDRLTRSRLVRMTDALAAAPAPWGADLSAAVVTAIGREKDAGHAVRVLRDVLVPALHPATAPAVQRLAEKSTEDKAVPAVLRGVLQYQSLAEAIREAFR